MKHILGFLIVTAAFTRTAGADDAASPADVSDTSIPRIVLHDILTNRVCIFESKLYSIGSKVIILGKAHECTNVNPMTFGDKDSEWDMQWVPVSPK